MGVTPTLRDIYAPFPTSDFEEVQGKFYIESRRIRMRLNDDTDGGWSVDQCTYHEFEPFTIKKTDHKTGEIAETEHAWIACDVMMTIPGLGTHPGTGSKRWSISSGEALDHVRRAAKSAAVRDAAGEFGYFAHLYADISGGIWQRWMDALDEPDQVVYADWLLDDWDQFLDQKDGNNWVARDYRRLWLGPKYDGVGGQLRAVQKALVTAAKRLGVAHDKLKYVTWLEHKAKGTERSK